MNKAHVSPPPTHTHTGRESPPADDHVLTFLLSRLTLRERKEKQSSDFILSWDTVQLAYDVSEGPESKRYAFECGGGG